jgi:hypothetical protein
VISKCKACGAEYRKGTLAIVLTPDGPKGHRVCGKCAAGGMIVVGQRVAAVVDSAKAVRREEKDVLAPFIANLKGQIRALAAFSERTDHQEGRLEAYEGVLHMLKEGHA